MNIYKITCYQKTDRVKIETTIHMVAESVTQAMEMSKNISKAEIVEIKLIASNQDKLS